MWKWVAKKYKKGSKIPVVILKREWAQKHGFEKDSICNDCFFCDYGNKHKFRVKVNCSGCSDCPGARVDKTFDCDNSGYAWDKKPIAFYNKLRSLNRKRKK